MKVSRFWFYSYTLEFLLDSSYYLVVSKFIKLKVVFSHNCMVGQTLRLPLLRKVCIRNLWGGKTIFLPSLNLYVLWLIRLLLPTTIQVVDTEGFYILFRHNTFWFYLWVQELFLKVLKDKQQISVIGHS